MINRLLLFFLLGFLNLSAFAQVSQTLGWQGSDGQYSDPTAACNSKARGSSAYQCDGSSRGSTCKCVVNDPSTGNLVIQSSVVMALQCPAYYSDFNLKGDFLCYKPPTPPPPACAPGFVDGGVDAATNTRTCTPKVCPAPSVLNSDGLCGAPPVDPGTSPSTGTTGPAGPTGPQGPKGDKGEKGDIGATGLTGSRGATGDQGEKGDTGSRGLKGDTGDTGVGIQGATGATGAAGANGATGAQGAKGDTGSQGIQGVKGEIGAQGIQGVQGLIGQTGLQGLRGFMGLTGADGAQGTQGETGKSFCEANPGLAACRDSSVSGACGAITCDGDAIQCSTLRAAAAIQCKQENDDKALKDSSAFAAGTAAMNGAVDPDAPSKEKAKIVDVDKISTSGWLGGGSFFKDKVISLPDGQSITIPLSQAENIFLTFRAVAMIMAALISAKIMRESLAGI